MSDLESRTSLSALLSNVTAQIDHDLAVTIADAINLYCAALKRNANRSILGPGDAVRILVIINEIQKGCADGAEDPELIPGVPSRGKPVSDPA